MANHHDLVAALKKVKTVTAQMGARGKQVDAQIDAAVAHMVKALALAAGLKTAQAKLTAKDNERKQLATPMKAGMDKNSANVKDIQNEAKALGSLVNHLRDNPRLKDAANKAKASALSGLAQWATMTERRAVDMDEVTLAMSSRHDELVGHQKALPKAGGDGLPSEDLKRLTDKVDALVKKLDADTAAARKADADQAKFDAKMKEIDDLQKKTIDPIVHGLAGEIANVAGALAAAKDQALQHEIDDGTPEGVRRSGAAAGIINAVAADYSDSSGKPIDPVVWAAKP